MSGFHEDTYGADETTRPSIQSSKQRSSEVENRECVFVATYTLPAVGTIIDLEFGLEETIIRATGRVTWIRLNGGDGPPGVGIAFLTLGDAERARIAEFCHLRSPLYYEE